MQANMAARVAKLADGKDAKPLSLASVLACWKAAVRDEHLQADTTGGDAGT